MLLVYLLLLQSTVMLEIPLIFLLLIYLLMFFLVFSMISILCKSFLFYTILKSEHTPEHPSEVHMLEQLLFPNICQ